MLTGTASRITTDAIAFDVLDRKRLFCEVRDSLGRQYLLAVKAFNVAAREVPTLVGAEGWRSAMERSSDVRAKAFTELARHRREHKC